MSVFVLLRASHVCAQHASQKTIVTVPSDSWVVHRVSSSVSRFVSVVVVVVVKVRVGFVNIRGRVSSY